MAKNTCRFCSNYCEFLKPIFREDKSFNWSNEIRNASDIVASADPAKPNILNMIQSLCGVQIYLFDELPIFICIICYDKLVSSYNFQQQCLLSIKKVNELLLHSKKLEEKSENNPEMKKDANNYPLILKCEPEFIEPKFFIQEIVDVKNEKQTHGVKKKHRPAAQNPLKHADIQTQLLQEKSQVCSVCGQIRTNLLLHMTRMHTNEGPFECDLCGKIFKAKSYLKDHFKIHLNIRNYKCKVCGKAFVGYATLRIHMINHTNARNYKCNICEKTFTQSCALGVHKKKHAQQMEYNCGFCELRFIDRKSKRNHEEILHKNKYPSFKCEFCSQTFRSTSNLSRHRLAHTKMIPYKCDLCDKTFIRKLDFNTHKRHHEYKII